MLKASPEQIDAIKTSTDAFLAFSNIAISSAERLTSVNMNAARAVLEKSLSASSLLLESNGSKQPSKAKLAIAEETTQDAMSYFSSVQNIATETQQELTDLMTSYFGSQFNGSNHASWLKGFDMFKQLGDQVTAMTEANRKAVTSATSKVASAASVRSTTHA